MAKNDKKMNYKCSGCKQISQLTREQFAANECPYSLNNSEHEIDFYLTRIVSNSEKIKKWFVKIGILLVALFSIGLAIIFIPYINPNGKEISTNNKTGQTERKSEVKNQETASKNAQEDAKRKTQEEAIRRAQEEANKRAQEEANRRAQEETNRRAQEDANRRAQEEADRRAQEEADRRAQEEAYAEECLNSIKFYSDNSLKYEIDKTNEINLPEETKVLGNYSGSNVKDNKIDVRKAGVGKHEIKYSIGDRFFVFNITIFSKKEPDTYEVNGQTIYWSNNYYGCYEVQFSTTECFENDCIKHEIKNLASSSFELNSTIQSKLKSSEGVFFRIRTCGSNTWDKSKIFSILINDCNSSLKKLD